VSRAALAALALMCTAAGAATVGCAQTPAAKMKSDLEVMKRESAADRLEARGGAFAEMGDYTRAEQYFVAAMKAGGPEKRLTQRLLAVCAAESRYPVAQMYAEDYLRRHPEDVEVRFASATIAAALGDNERARGALERVVEARPQHADAHFALASVLKAEEDHLGADRHFREYLRLAPAGAHAEAARGSVLRTVPQP